MIGMDLKFDVDMLVMNATVSYNHLSIIGGDELISIRGLLLLCLVTSLILLISWSANFIQVCLIRFIKARFQRGSSSVGSRVVVH